MAMAMVLALVLVLVLFYTLLHLDHYNLNLLVNLLFWNELKNPPPK